MAAVLANMAASPDCRGEVVRHGGLPVLLRFLNARPQVEGPNRSQASDGHAQRAATERVQQKSAIAISR